MQLHRQMLVDKRDCSGTFADRTATRFTDPDRTSPTANTACTFDWRGTRPVAPDREFAGKLITSSKKLASMLYREHVCVKIGNPLLTLLRDSKVAQGITDIWSYLLPEEIGI